MPFKRRVLLNLSWSLLVCAVLPAAVDAQAKPDPDRVVVLISVDGLAHFYMDDPQAQMPNIRALQAAGARASMRPSTPTVTWPNHTTLVTGVPPALHGVTGNNCFDRSTRKVMTLIGDPVYDKDQIVKVPTLYDAAKAAGLKTAAIRWPAARNARTLDWNIPTVRGSERLRKYSTPGLLAELEKEGLDLDRGDEASTQPTPGRLSGDAALTRAFIHILRRHRPQLGLLHIGELDHEQHLNGPRSKAAYRSIKKSDALVGEVWQALQRDFPGKATLVVVSDHGFSPIRHAIYPNIVLRDAGLVEVKDKKVTGGPIRVIVQGGSALIYILDDGDRPALIERVTATFQKVRGVSRIVDPAHLKDYGVADPKDDPRAPDMLLFAEEGCVFGDTADGELPFVDKPERRGSHGHDPDLPHLQATFVAWGVGIKPGVDLEHVDNTQVAPTMARLLGLTLSEHAAEPLSRALAP